MSKELCLDAGAELLADWLGVIQIAQMARRRRPISMTPRTEYEIVLVIQIVRFEHGVLNLRSKHIFLVVVAAHGQSGNSNCRERMLYAARAPDAVISGVFEEEFPGGQCFGAGLFHVFRKVSALQKKIKTIAWLPVLVLAVVRDNFFFAALHSEHVVVAVTLAEGAVVEEVIAHPCIDHRRLRRDGLHGGVRINAGRHGQKAWIAGADESRAPVVALHILQQPCHRVVCVCTLVRSLSASMVSQRSAHDELALALVAAANILRNIEVAVASQLLPAAEK